MEIFIFIFFYISSLVNKANEEDLIQAQFKSDELHYLPFLYDKSVFSEKWINKCIFHNLLSHMNDKKSKIVRS